MNLQSIRQAKGRVKVIWEFRCQATEFNELSVDFIVWIIFDFEKLNSNFDWASLFALNGYLVGKYPFLVVGLCRKFYIQDALQ